MDFSLTDVSVSERRRAHAVARRLERNREGITTRHYHRNQRLMNAVFLVLAALSTVLVGALLLG